MMEDRDETVPYEILIRFPKNGEPPRAQAQYARTVVKDGEVLKDWEPGAVIDGKWTPGAVVLLSKDFPVGDALTAAHRDALIIMNEAVAENVVLRSREAEVEQVLKRANDAILKEEARKENQRSLKVMRQR